jgi:AcrR family transcriptional regulator
VERGYSGTRMTDIAERAQVAVQTVYFTFHTKAELLRACYDVAVCGPENVPPPMQQWHRYALSAKTAKTALARFVAGNGEIVARAGLLDHVVRAATHEPDAVEVRAATERLRREGYRDFADRLASLGMKTIPRRQPTSC